MTEVVVFVFRGKNLCVGDEPDHARPYVTVHYGANKWRTKTKTSAVDPEWNESHTFDVGSAGEPVVFDVFDQTTSQFIGRLVMPTNKLIANKKGSKVFNRLKDKFGKSDKRRKAYLKVGVVLLTKEPPRPIVPTSVSVAVFQGNIGFEKTFMTVTYGDNVQTTSHVDDPSKEPFGEIMEFPHDDNTHSVEFHVWHYTCCGCRTSLKGHASLDIDHSHVGRSSKHWLPIVDKRLRRVGDIKIGVKIEGSLTALDGDTLNVRVLSGKRFPATKCKVRVLYAGEEHSTRSQSPGTDHDHLWNEDFILSFKKDGGQLVFVVTFTADTGAVLLGETSLNPAGILVDMWRRMWLPLSRVEASDGPSLEGVMLEVGVLLSTRPGGKNAPGTPMRSTTPGRRLPKRLGDVKTPKSSSIGRPQNGITLPGFSSASYSGDNEDFLPDDVDDVEVTAMLGPARPPPWDQQRMRDANEWADFGTEYGISYEASEDPRLSAVRRVPLHQASPVRAADAAHPLPPRSPSSADVVDGLAPTPLEDEVEESDEDEVRVQMAAARAPLVGYEADATPHFRPGSSLSSKCNDCGCALSSHEEFCTSCGAARVERSGEAVPDYSQSSRTRMRKRSKDSSARKLVFDDVATVMPPPLVSKSPGVELTPGGVKLSKAEEESDYHVISIRGPFDDPFAEDDTEGPTADEEREAREQQRRRLPRGQRYVRKPGERKGGAESTSDDGPLTTRDEPPSSTSYYSSS